MATYIAPTTKGWTSQKFGMNPGGFNPSGGHTGEDIAIPVGTPLVAMADGVVVHSGYFTGAYNSNPWWIQPSFAGFVVTVDYGAYLSHYAHCSGSPVRKGQSVRQGQEVAYSGNTGSATTGPHLHWEVMPDGFNLNNGRYGRINPRSLLNIIAPASTPTPSSEDDMTAAQMQELKDFIYSTMGTMLTQYHEVTRSTIKEEIKTSAYDVKVFVQDVDNGNTDRAIHDARDEVAKVLKSLSDTDGPA